MAKKDALAVWNQRLADLAKKAKKTVAGIGGAGNFLSIKGGVLSYQDATIADNKMQCIIVDSILENQWFKEAYDPSAPQTPNCYAFGRDKDEMAPDPEQVEEPQSDNCSTCELMQFGSADTGRGKACKECSRLALITEGDLEDIEDAVVAFMKLPFFSNVNYAAYVRQLDELYHKPPLAFVTEIHVTPDPKSQFRVNFKMIQELDDPKVFEQLWAKFEDTSTKIAFPYPKLEAVPARRAAPARAKPARVPAKQVSAKKATTTRVVAAKPVKVGLRQAVKSPKF